MLLRVIKLLLNAKHDSIIMRWMTNLNMSIKHLVFGVNQ
jgi:hypothetical protein